MLLSTFLLKSLLAGVLISFGALIGYNIYLAWQCPLIECREMTNVVVIQSIREGTVQDVTALPENIYLYGLLQGWFLSWLPESVNLVTANRFCSLLCLLLSSIVLSAAICAAVHLAQKKPLPPLTLLILFICSLLPHLYDMPMSLGTPNYSGLLFSNLVLLCALRPSRSNAILFPLLITACMATKSYYLFSLVYVVCSYLFIRKDSYRWAEALFVAVTVILGGWWHFSSEQSQYALIHHLAQRTGAGTDIYRLFRVGYWLITVSGVLVLTLSSMRGMRWREVKQGVAATLGQAVKYMVKSVGGKKIAVVPFVVCTAIAATVVIFRMGQHRGMAGILYFAQLLTPPLIIAASYILSVYPARRATYSIALFAVMVTNLLIIVGRTDRLCRHLQIPADAVAQDFLRHRGKVRGSGLTGPTEWSLFRRVTDNGQLKYSDTIYWSDKASPIRRANEAYKKRVADAIRQQTYDVIYTDPISYLNENRFPELKEYYAGTKSGSNGNHFTRWLPKQRTLSDAEKE